MGFSVLIPARLASTRLPRKPLADIAGVPMVVRVARQAALSSATQIVVAADDAEIVAACKAHQVDAILTRSDHANGSDRLAFPVRDGIPVMLEGEARVLGNEPPAPPIFPMPSASNPS